MLPFPAPPTENGFQAPPALGLVAAQGTGSPRRPSRRPARHFERALLETLDGVIAELDKLPELTERTFLAVCGELLDFRARLQTISKNTAQAALLMSGSAALSVIDEVRQALGCMEEGLEGTNRRVDRAVLGLGGIITELDASQRLVAEFKDLVGVLRMLKTTTNILGASAANGGAGFQQVAADIGTLSQDVQAKSAAITAKRRELSAELQKAVATVSALQGRQRKLAADILGNIRHGLASLTGMHEKCTVAAEELAGRSGMMSQELGEVVTALQFHDITSQRFAHARKALADLRFQLGKEGREEENEALPLSPEGVCPLQAAQIASSTKQVQQATACIGRNLEGIAAGAAAASRDIHSLFGMAGSAGESSIAGIENGLAAVMAAFADNGAVLADLGRTIAAVTAAMGEITTFAGDINFIGSEIKLIALNAGIKAVQAGNDGAAFGVIAATVKRQSEELCRQASAISASIGRIGVQVESLREEMATLQAGGGAESGGMAGALTALRGLSRAVGELLAETDNTAAGLAAGIAASISTLNDEKLREVLFREVPARLDRLAVVVREVARESGDDGAGKAVDMLRHGYTMRSEREVHARFSAPGSAESDFSSVAEAVRGRGDHDFGDNVELF